MDDTTKVLKNATPGTDDEAAKKARLEKHEARNHPAITEDTKLEELPGDYSFKDHNPIKRKNFKAEEFYYDYRAAYCKWQAEQFERKAHEARTLGSAADRAKAKRLKSMQAKMAELTAELEAQGVDVSSLLANAG